MGWKVGDRCLAQDSDDEGWYPADINMINTEEALVTFEHNLQYKKVSRSRLRMNKGYTSFDSTAKSNYETADLQEEDQQIGDGIDHEDMEEKEDSHEDEANSAGDPPNEEDASEDLEEEASNENETDDCYKTGVEAAWAEGEECVARWAEDGCWYRAVVDGVEGDTAVVTFTQYGNSDYCRLEDLRPADTELGEDGQLVVPEQDREENGDDEEEWS